MSSGRTSSRRSNGAEAEDENLVAGASPSWSPRACSQRPAIARCADEPIEIFDAHLHYNWEPKPFYQLDEVLALFKKHRVTGILATSRPNTGTHALVDAKADGLAGRAVHPAVPRPRRYRQTGSTIPSSSISCRTNSSAAIIAASANFICRARRRTTSG